MTMKAFSSLSATTGKWIRLFPYTSGHILLVIYTDLFLYGKKPTTPSTCSNTTSQMTIKVFLDDYKGVLIVVGDDR